MPANLPYDAKAKWLEVTMTSNPESKLQLMQEFMGLVPKHKGTDKLRAQVKRQMAGLREEIENKKKQAKTGRGPSYFVQKAGAAQISLLGPPNSGKSSLLKAITNANVEITTYPFSTRVPTPGMLPYEDIQFQIVEVPPIIEGSSEGKAEGFQNLSMARNSDALIILVDLTNNPVEDILMVLGELDSSRILTKKTTGKVEIQRRGHGRNIQFIWEGELVDCTNAEVVSLLNEYKIRSALVRIRGKVTLDIVEDALFENSVYRPTICMGSKLDLLKNHDIIDEVRKIVKPLEFLPISTQNTLGLPSMIGEKLFKLLDITRIYTKEQGRQPRRDPIISHGEITVGELAKIVHNDFFNNFKYARIWGPSAKFPNEKVGLERELKDTSIIQLYV